MNETLKNQTRKLFMIIIILVTMLAMLFISKIIAPELIPTKNEIPNVVGMSISDAKIKLKEAGFKVDEKILEEESDIISEDRVIKTDPEIGSKVRKKSIVTLTVSTGDEKVIVENYIGRDIDETILKLTEKGLIVTVDKVDRESEKGLSENIIIDQSIKANTKLNKKDEITLVVPNIITTYPDFTNGEYTLNDVKTFCNSHGIELILEMQQTLSYPEGYIISQNKEEGTLVKDNPTIRVRVATKVGSL